MNGIGVSKGIGLGKVFIKREIVTVKKDKILNHKEEVKYLEKCIESVSNDIEKLYENKLEELGKKDAQIFEAHKMIIKDPELFSKIKNYIVESNYSSAYATDIVIKEYVSMFEKMENEYFRLRALDMKDVGKRLIRKILDLPSDGLKTINEPTVLVAKDLTPSDTAQLNINYIEGIITEDGGSTSHSAIIARTLGIPAIMGVKNILDRIDNDDYIVLDGNSGNVLINPNNIVVNEYKNKRENLLKKQKELEKFIGKKTITKDNKEIELSANIASINDIDNAIMYDAEGIGLFRSEFIFMEKNSLPTEEEQFNIYKRALEKFSDKPIIIRTMDIGGDKEVSYLNFKKEMNPFLGYRAIRYSLDNIEVFKTQLRALFRASIYGRLKIMFPMISSLKELKKIKLLIKEVKEELDFKNKKYSRSIEIGIMIEVPSAAIMADKLAKKVDFFSIGTNDLIQYMTATDRMNSKLKNLYTPYNPGVLRIINDVIKKGHKEGIWVGMCGSVAGNQCLIPLLLAMGLDEFSMSPTNILESRALINSFSINENEKLVNRILDAEDSDEVKRILNITQ